MEHAVHAAAPTFEAKAKELEREGRPEAAEVLWTLADGAPQDLHEMAAFVLRQMQKLDQDQRDRAMQALHGCALYEKDAGRPKSMQMIVTALEELGALYGLPGERAGKTSG